MTAAAISEPSPSPPTSKSLHHDYNEGVDLAEVAEEVNDLPKDDPAALQGPYSRPLGDTEHNWCRAVGSGTGITVLSILFSKVVEVSALQHAVDHVQWRHPRLRSHLLWINGHPAFKVLARPSVQVEIVDASSPPSSLPCPEAQEEDEYEDAQEFNEQYPILQEGKQEDKTAEERENLESTSSEPENDGANIDEWRTADVQDAESHPWMSHIETELNENAWPELHHSLDPVSMFAVRLYLLPENRSLLILRLHTAICDRVSAGTVLVDILIALREQNSTTEENSGRDAHVISPQDLESCRDIETPEQTENFETPEQTENFISIEDGIPPGQANKPFWAHGLDMLGYSLGSMRNALLPFDDYDSPRRSKYFHSVLTVDHTKLLLEECEKRNTNLHGAISAAGLKAAAAVKSLGRRSEHFALVSLINCRRLLQPELSESAVGFYHSALMQAHHVNEETEFWELAKRCSNSLQDAMKRRKHFTDMGDINFLMYQALQRPALTPYSSLRTSLLVVFRDPVLNYMQDVVETLGVEHYIGCSSCHGVGPALAIFDSIRKGALHFTGVYPSPLYSRAQILTYVRCLVDILVQSTEP